MNHKPEKAIYALLILVSIFNVMVSSYILLNQFNGIKQRESLQKSTNKITCILLIHPEDRSDESIKKCN